MMHILLHPISIYLFIMANINRLPLDVFLEIARHLPAEDLIRMLALTALARRAAALQLNVTTPVVINGTQNLVIFAQAVQANIVNVQTIRSLEIVNVRPANPQLITPTFLQILNQLPALESIHLSNVDTVGLFPGEDIIQVETNLQRLTMDIEGTNVEARIRFMDLCIAYSDTLQELHVQGLTNVVYASRAYFHYDLPSRLTLDFQHITALTLQFNIRVQLNLQQIMLAVPNLLFLNIHNMSRRWRRATRFNTALFSPNGAGHSQYTKRYNPLKACRLELFPPLLIDIVFNKPKLKTP